MEQSGFYIAVTNNSQLPLTKFEGIKIATGFATNIAVKNTFYYKLGPPYSNCRKDVSTYSDDDSIYYRETLKVNTYSQKLCFQICIQYEYIMVSCNCSDPSIPLDDSYPICSAWDDLTCVANVRSSLSKIDVSENCSIYIYLTLIFCLFKKEIFILIPRIEIFFKSVYWSWFNTQVLILRPLLSTWMRYANIRLFGEHGKLSNRLLLQCDR